MLPKKNRLTKKKDFDRVFKDGKSVKKDFLVVRVLKNHLADSRFGFVVSKKVSLKAVARNKARRRLQDAVAAAMPALATPVDVVLIALPAITKKEFNEVKVVVANLLNAL